ncbi:DUF2147 domain-containing protein [Sphingomonas xinjiangensis]|uniref:Uncharacterized protein (DUF2147 family) n=1 Tax=Sphingomonas xinjiangensis TaxID=643568 RepID=A0A840YCP6_9SPHN|nr:DUF2147 domain-containing protein [Sphingomonas xinjiangensis]MBB5711157.1 uncharacterized protein (DUF2147 family) [Sphingomonas xinjiangensis]
MIALLLALLAPAPLQAAPPELSQTVWQNPRNSVHVRFEPCGAQLCGTVIWASDKAIADAARGSSQPLVGTRIFRDFRPAQAGVWRGRVYVPDLATTFSGRITVEGDRLIGRGCLIAGLGCKSQTWSRVR